MHSSGSHLSKDMLDLIKSIGDSRSKQEEDKIIVKEVEVLKKKIKESGIVPKKMKEYLIRAIYIEMLGHEAPFAHLYSVNLTQDKNILNKRVGYLACCLLLSDQSEFLIMLVASLQKDIQSLNWVEVCMALTCVVKFANSTIMQAVTEPVMKLLENKNEQVRKKAVMCLYRFYQVSPQSVPDCDSRMRRLLCDFDPSVMAATLPYFKEMCMKNPENYKDLVSPLIVILKQVIEHKLPREYDYHRFPGPWIQVILLEILSILGRDDKSASENMYEILQQCLRRADDTGINIGYAIVYQCLKTICTIYPNPHLIELASNTISRFLSSDSPNLRCTGINGLAMIIQINPNYVLNHQQIIVDCLEENDETLKKNTFELLYKMTSLKNVEVIVEKMMNYLKHTTLESVSKKDILTKITELTERFAPSKTWFIRIMNELFVNFGEMITDDILAKLIKIINEWEKETEDEEEFKSFTIENYAKIVEEYAVLPDSFVKLMAWVIGEYTNQLYANEPDKIEKILEMLSYLLNKNYDDEMTKCLLISAIAKVHSNMGFSNLDFVNDIIEKYSRDKNPEIQQRCLEYKRMQNKAQIIEKNQFTTIVDETTIDPSLEFLNDYVQTYSNGKVYDPDYAERITEKFNSSDMTLNVGPYSTPENILSMNSSQSANINRLYESKDNNLVKNMKNELNVRVAQKWGEKGYVDEKPIERPRPMTINTNSIGSGSNTNTNYSTNSTIYTNKSNNPYSAVAGPTPSKDSIQGTTVYPKPTSKKQEPVYDPNSLEKKKLMNDLFGGSSSTTSKQEKPVSKPQPVSHQAKPVQQSKPSSGGLFGNLKVNQSTSSSKPTQPKPAPQQPQSVNLLGFDDVKPATSTPITTQPQTQQPTMDLLNDIFGATSTTQPVQQNTQPVQQNTQPSLFDNLGINTVNNTQPVSAYTPNQIDADVFEKKWEAFPDEDSYTINVGVGTPEKFKEIITSKGNFHCVSILSNEVISSALYKNQTVLLFANIEEGSTPILVKCENQSLNNEVANYVISLFN